MLRSGGRSHNIVSIHKSNQSGTDRTEFHSKISGPQSERRKVNYTEFVHAVETMINQRKEGGLKATVYTAVRNNDTRRTGVILETPGINLSPTIYLKLSRRKDDQ